MPTLNGQCPRKPGPTPGLPDHATRHALLLHDDAKGLLQALIVFEDGGTTIAQYFPSTAATMRSSIRDAKTALVKTYEIRRGNIRTKSAILDPPDHRHA